MRVLVTSTAGTGHVHPIVPLARAMRDAGHDVVWAVAAESVPIVERHGIPARACGIGPDERLGRFRERFPNVGGIPPRERRPVMAAGLFGWVAAPAMIADLVEIVDDVAPDLVIHDPVEFAAVPVAVARGIPHVAVAFSGALPAVVVAAVAPALEELWASQGQTAPDDLGFHDHAYLHPFPPGLGSLPNGPGVLPMRPLHEDGAGEEPPPPWLAELGTRRPLVYVTFGTEMGQVAPWGLVLGACAELDADVVATIGGRLDPAVLGPLPTNLRVERYIPQSHLLRRASLVVSHGGAGTVLAACAAGLAQVMIPLGADQFENGDAVVAAGAGIMVEGSALTESGMSQAMRSAFIDRRVTAAAEVLRDEMAAMPHPVALVPVLESVVGDG